jgi:hypothetical protein
MNVYKFDIEPFETDFEFEDTLESVDEFTEEVQGIFPEYGEEESWSFDPESADLLQDESPFRDAKTADWEYESALDVLSPSELKAVRITSTFETGRPGGFGGLTGNIDGQGLSFGILNFTIKAGSLIPLLKEFIINIQGAIRLPSGKMPTASKRSCLLQSQIRRTRSDVSAMWIGKWRL